MFKFDILNRPIAPHLLIYIPQLSSLFSIWHRISGIILISLFASFLLTIKLLSSFDFSLFSILLLILSISLKSQWLANYVYLLSLTVFLYHSFNGIRHIIWDLGFLMSIKNLLKSSFALIFLVLLVLHLNLLSL